jgi:ribosomal protein S6
MDRKAFARVADKRHSAGFYANVIFAGSPAIISQLQKKFSLSDEIFRVLFTLLPEPKPVKA